MNRLWFLRATEGNCFMNELLGALASAAARAGAEVQWASDSYPEPECGDAYVVIPHEFFECAPDGGRPTAAQLAGTVAVCVEQPGTQWFELSAAYASRVGRTLEIHRSACSELARRGIPAEQLALGYVPEWDLWHGAEAPRPVDVLYLGSEDQRRAGLLGGFAETLTSRTTRFLIPPLGPKRHSTPNFLTGSDKYRQLAASKLLLNLHRSGASGLFEWMRALEAICNGCVLVSEHSTDHLPLVPGEHFLSGRAEDLGLLAHGLLENPQRAEQIRRSAYEFIRSELTIDTGIGALLDAGLAAARSARAPAVHAAGSAPRQAAQAQPPPAASPQADAGLDAIVTRQLAPLRTVLKSLTLGVLDARRRLEALEHGLGPGEPQRDAQVLAETNAYRVSRPRISVLISLHNYEREVLEALASVARAAHSSYEVLVLDDASTDGSSDAVRGFLRAHDWLPAALLAHRANRGLGVTRNALIDRARGEFVFILDADNAVFPTTLIRLEDALDSSPGASFAYGMSVIEERGQAVGLNSVGLWDPHRFIQNNYIDAMALIRRSALVELGGYAEDIRLTGWEDFDLWLRMAESDMHPVHVPEIVGRYRRSGHSMLASITNIDAEAAWSVVRARSPSVFGARAAARGPVAQLLTDPPSDGIELWLDEPRSGSTVRREQILLVSGWAASVAGVGQLSVRVGALEREPHRGLPRPDVAAMRPRLRDARCSGFKLVIPVSELPRGRHELVVSACSADGQSAQRRATVEIDPTAYTAGLPSPSESVVMPTGSSLELWILAEGASSRDLARTLEAIEKQPVRPCAVRVVSTQPPLSTVVGHTTSLESALHGVTPEAEYVVTVKAGDAPDFDALMRIAEATGIGDADVIYGDDDMLSALGRREPFHKPAWSPELQANLDYVGSFAAINVDRLSRAIARRPDASGGGELVAGLLDEPRLHVRHLPHVLCTRAERATRPKQGLARHERSPLVSVVIPTAGRGEHLARCLRSISARRTYEHLELVIVDTSGGRLGNVKELCPSLSVRLAAYDRPFNYSTAVNEGVRLARGEYLVLLNDDVEVITPDWVERMLEQALRPGVGVVGAKLVRSDGTIQHGGVLLHAGSAEHLFDFFEDDGDGYHELLGVPRNCSAVTAACLMISSGLYDWLGGLDDGFVLDYGDTDLCLRAIEEGQRVVWTPHAVLRHDDRSSRGAESPLADLQMLRKHWGPAMERGDPYYNPNLAVRPQFEPLAASTPS